MARYEAINSDILFGITMRRFIVRKKSNFVCV